MQSSIEIPNKSLFKINEVCNITGIKPYVLRYWETEFEQIRPISSSSGQKMYEQKDIEAIAMIKKLLFDDKFTIERAKMEMEKLFTGASDGEHFVMASSHEFEEVGVVRKNATSRSLTDSDVQKLVMAKAKLNSLIMLAGEVEQRNNWT